MNKRLEIIPLIKQSFLLSTDVKIRLLERLDEMSEEEVVTLGELLAQERDFAVANATKIQEYADTLVDYFRVNPISSADSTEQVYVGTGKAT